MPDPRPDRIRPSAIALLTMVVASLATQPAIAVDLDVLRARADGRVDVLPRDGGLTDAPSNASGAAVRIDVGTRSLHRSPAPSTAPFPPAAESHFGAVDALFGEDVDTVLRRNMNGWTIVGDPTAGDATKRVKIFIEGTTVDGDAYDAQCSGTMISPRHVLTAGHCVYTHALSNGTPVNDFVDGLIVIPAYEQGNSPWGFARSVAMVTWSRWIDDRDRSDDMALVTLDRPVGGLAGWHSFGYNTSCSYWEDPTWILRGYPAQAPYDGETMWETSGSFDDCGGDLAQFFSASFGGASGSGAVRDAVVRGTLASSDRVSSTVFTRMNADKFAFIESTILADQPDLPDVQPLFLRTAANEGSIDAGGTLTGISFVLHNFAALAWSGAVDYRLVLSTDATIDGSDRLLLDSSLNAIVGANGSAVFGLPNVQIPHDTAPGAYRLGLILDVNDANPANDVTWSTQDQDRFDVTCGVPAVVAPAGPVDGLACTDLDGVLLRWTLQADADSYELEWGPLAGTKTLLTGLPSFGYVLGTLDAGVTYAWRVRARNVCGNSGAWTAWQTFTTRDDPAVPVVTSPPDGDTCQDGTDAVVDWDDVPGALAYQIRISSQCGVPVPPVTVTQSQRTYTSLNPDVTWYYEVRTQGACGNWGAWSACRSFTTLPDGFPVTLPAPSAFSPQDGYGCVGGPLAGVAWNRVDDADSYEVVYGRSCDTGDTLLVDTNVAAIPVDGGGVWVWRVRSLRCGVVSPWSPCQTFSVDATAPPSVENVQSASHEIERWNANPEVVLTWNDLGDAGSCGIASNELVWTQGPVPPPFPWFTSAGGNGGLVGPLDEGDDNWIHLWTKDAAGNYAAIPVTIGPFWIDASGPEDPIVTSTPSASGFTDATSLAFAWNTPADTWTRTAGFAFGLVGDPAEPIALADVVEENETQYHDLDEADFWFRIAAVDEVGNASAIVTVGPFRIDTTPPVAVFRRPIDSSGLQHTSEVQIRFVADDARSGMADLFLEYTPDGSQWRPIASGPAADFEGRTTWTVPFVESGQVRLRLRAFDVAGNEAIDTTGWLPVSSAVDAPAASGFPRDLALDDPSPNPFNPRTTIRFGVPVAGTVRLRLHDAAGRVVRTLVDAPFDAAGWHEVTWNGHDDAGRRVSSGVYFARVEADGDVRTVRMTLLK